jgi:MraZ protein
VVKCGEIIFIFTPYIKNPVAALIGEFECSIDDKARLMLPSALKKQLPKKDSNKFVINRGFEKQLNLYPWKEWDKVTSSINNLNLFVQKNREFVRRFNNGATELELDSSGRILLPKSLMLYAGISKEAILFAHSDRIEIWSKQEYDKYMKQGADDFAKLAEEVMGKMPNEKGDVS